MGEKERKIVSDMYDGPKWKARVAAMSDEQVIAIYLRPKPEKEKKPQALKKSKKKPKKDLGDTLF